jgi:osmotically-inducible protein OsmY
MHERTETPEAYLGEQTRDAIAQEAHVLGIRVTVEADEACLEGRVESADQRARIEAIAARVLGPRTIRNRIEVVTPDQTVTKEELS